MTIGNVLRSVSYTTTGLSLGPFDVPFQFFELSVYLDTVLVDPTRYTIAGGSGLTGSITFTGSPTPAGLLTIVGDTASVQQTDYEQNASFPAASHEKALDRLTMLDQELKQRALLLNIVSQGSVDPTLPLPSSKRLIGWNAAADGLLNYAPVDIDLETVSALGADLIEAETSEDARLLLGLSDTGPIIAVANGDFTLWTTKPASGSAQSPGSGVGFSPLTIADGWYGGPGPSSQYTFSRSDYDTVHGTYAGKLAWDVSVNAGEAQHIPALGAGYWRFSFLEYNGHISPQFFAGKTITIDFEIISSGVNTVVPIGFLSMGNQSWVAATQYYVGDYVLNGNAGEFSTPRVYVCTTAGISAGSGGPSGTGTGIADGAAVWSYFGEEKGREFEEYEAGDSPTAARIAWGTPHANAVVTTTTSWQRVQRSMYIPALDEGTGTRYAGQPHDTGSRVFTPPAGLGAYFGIAFDLYENAATGPAIRLRNVKVYVGTAEPSSQQKLPRDLEMMIANGFASMLALYATNLYQPVDADLTALAGNSTNGLWAHTGAGTGAARTLQAPAAGFSITNPAGVAGDPTFVLANDLAALEALSSTGFGVRSAANTWVQRSLTAPAAGVSISNNDGVSGNPTFALANDLAALEGLGSTGFAARTTTDTWAQRTLQVPAAGLTVSNPAGVAGDPTFALANDLAALEALSGTNTMYYRSATDTWSAVTIGGNMSFSAGTLNAQSIGTFAVRGVTGKNNAGTPLTQFDLTANEVVLRDSSGFVVTRLSPGTLTNNISTAGSTAGGRDQAGAFTVSSWVHLYWIWNGTTLSTLSSASATAPTLPSGYTHLAYACAVRIDGSGNFLAVHLAGKLVTYDARQNAITNGAATSSTSIALSALVPPNALTTILNCLYFGGTTNGSGNYSTTLNLQVVSGTDCAHFAASFNGPASTVSYLPLTNIVLPNLSQTVYYYQTVSAGTSPLTSLDVVGYTVPNGS